MNKNELRLTFSISLFFLSFSIFVRAQILGCTDPLAANYDISATQNDGSCTYTLSSVAVLQSWDLPSEVVETSGLASWDNAIWTHNDNTDTKLYALDTSSSIVTLSELQLTDLTNHDWEEIKVDDMFIYLADVGNNANGNRQDLQILRIDRTSLSVGNPQVDTIHFSYSEQVNFLGSGPNATDFDCEAFITTVDSIFLFTKEWNSNKTTMYALPNMPGNYVAQKRGELDVQGLITGATSMLDDQLIILVGYTESLMPFFYLLYDFDQTDFFGGNKRKVPINLPFHQIEGVTTSNGISVLVSNEKFQQSTITINQKLHCFDLTSFLMNYLNPSSLEINAPIEVDAIHVFPNPVTGDTYIQVAESLIGKSFVVSSELGDVLLEHEITSSLSCIDFSFLPCGVYQIVISGKPQRAFKFVVQR